MVEPAYSENMGRAPELSAKPVDKRPIIFGILGAVIIIVVFSGIGVWLYYHPQDAAIFRDIFIIFLGLGAFFVILLLIALVIITGYLVLKVNDLIQLLNREIKPILLKIQETLGTAQGTVTFLSDHAVQPVISTASTIAAIRAITRSLFRRE